MPMAIASVLSPMLKRRTLSLAAVAMLVSACGGGSDTPSTELPQITLHPANASVEAGESAEFRIEVQSSTPVSYQWMRNGSPISGATGATFSIPSAATTDSGSNFSVQVSNVAGNSLSHPAMLLVRPQGWNEGIAAASSDALFTLSEDRTAVAFSKSGDLFVWERTKRQLTRITADGAAAPLQGSMQALDVNAWRIAVLEHSDGSLYVAETYLAPSGQINTEHGGGGKIHRISPNGTHSVVYQSVIPFGDAPDGKITPVGIAQDALGNIITLHFNSPTLYKIPTTSVSSPPIKFADLIPQPFDQLAIVLGYSVTLSLTSTSSGEIFASSSNGTTAFAFNSANYDAFDYLINTDGTRTAVKFGATYAYDLATHSEYVYALVKNSDGYMCLVRRAPDGAVQVIAGGSGSTTETGPLSGGLGNWVRLVGVTPEGRIVLGELQLDESRKYLKYFVVTPRAD